MHKLLLLLVMICVLLLAYGLHKLIRKFIDPKASANHAFLFFIAHFIGVFILAFITSLAIIQFRSFLFPS